VNALFKEFISPLNSGTIAAFRQLSLALAAALLISQPHDVETVITVMYTLSITSIGILLILFVLLVLLLLLLIFILILLY
jgi:hypothetical protein